ncbi:hypothetical protein MTBBW1_1820004 [Desulfamplus magnetovallimortis]|uniref:Uncharacterized protein n=1 Tax=Desulfamplus magnetovallimortis TaxID=1246637 RepID=A0A1W1HAR6_9BACT|nr:hypothetical protein [Desulfamplus magnetovallimortis]SLM29485.1 hypothetical protein MTBBW1_1820004 [Desulfamplus magnetovallimortis]
MIFNLLGIPVNPAQKKDTNRINKNQKIAKAAKRVAATLTGLSPETLVAVNQPLAMDIGASENMKFITQVTVQGRPISVFFAMGEKTSLQLEEKQML